MTTFYGVDATRRTTPGQNNSNTTEMGGQLRLAHDYFVIGSGGTPNTISQSTDDVVSLNSLLIPKFARIIGGYMTCDRLVASSPGWARVQLGTAADMAAITPVIDLLSGSDALLNVWLNDDSLNTNYQALVAIDVSTGGPYINKLPDEFCAWIRPDATSNDWDQSANGATVGIYYVID